MNPIIRLVSVFLFVTSTPVVVPCQLPPSGEITALSQHQARDLARNAHTPVEYGQLANYFHQQEIHYRSKAAAQKIELDRRMKITTGPSQKFPRPADSTQNLYDYYVSCAEVDAAKARHFDLLASGH